MIESRNNTINNKYYDNVLRDVDERYQDKIKSKDNEPSCFFFSHRIFPWTELSCILKRSQKNTCVLLHD